MRKKKKNTDGKIAYLYFVKMFPMFHIIKTNSISAELFQKFFVPAF